MKWLSAAVVFAVASWVVFPAQSQEKIVIGQSAPLTGPAADIGRDIRDGALAVFARVNATGGIGGRQIELVTLDDANDRKRAGANAKVLIDERNAITLFGFASATLSLDAIPQAEAKGMAHFAPFTGSLAIRDKKSVFTIRASYQDEIEKIVAYWATQGVGRMAVLHYDDEVGKQNFKTVADLLGAKGQPPLQISVKRNVKVDAAAFEPLFQQSPQVLVATTQFGPVLDALSAMQAKGRSIPISALSFVNPDELASVPGGAARGTTVTQVVPSPRNSNVQIVRECGELLKAANLGNLNYTNLEACIAAKVLVEALKKAGRTPSRPSVVAALEGLGRVDVGGFVVTFSKEARHGSKWTDLSILSRGGTFRH